MYTAYLVYLYQAWNISLILGVNSNNWIPIIKRFTVCAYKYNWCVCTCLYI